MGLYTKKHKVWINKLILATCWLHPSLVRAWLEKKVAILFEALAHWQAIGDVHFCKYLSNKNKCSWFIHRKTHIMHFISGYKRKKGQYWLHYWPINLRPHTSVLKQSGVSLTWQNAVGKLKLVDVLHCSFVLIFALCMSGFPFSAWPFFCSNDIENYSNACPDDC